MSLFLVLSSNISICADCRIRKNTDTNEILREGVTAKKSSDNNNSGTQRLGKRHLGDDSFKAFECREEDDLSTAEFSLNEPPPCNKEDGSAYYPPVPKRAQILQKIKKIPVEVTIC